MARTPGGKTDARLATTSCSEVWPACTVSLGVLQVIRVGTCTQQLRLVNKAGIGIKAECRPSFKFKRKTGTLSSACEELYLRGDISCGSQMCGVCDPSTLIMAPDVPHILLPDEHLITSYLDVFELPELRNYVLCASELRQIAQSGSTRLKARIRGLYRDSRRGVYQFDNIHHLQTSQATPRYGGSPLLAAAHFYHHHLGGAVGVVVLSDALEERVEVGLEASLRHLTLQAHGVRVLSMQQYIQQYWSHNSTVLQLFDSLQQALISKEQGKAGERGRQRFRPYSAPHIIEEGLASGELLQGTLIMQRAAAQRNEGVVQVGSHGEAAGQLVRISGRQALNRAMHGDVVVLRLLPESLQPIAGGNNEGGNTIGTTGETVEEEEEEDVMSESLASSGAEVAEEDAEPELLEDEAGEEKEPSVKPSQLLLSGEVVGIVQRSNTEVVACLSLQDEQDLADGSSRRTGSMVRVIPLDPRYPIAIVHTRHPDKLAGQRFVIRMDDWSPEDGFPDAHITRILGSLNSVQAETEAILVQCGIHWQPFCDSALAELPSVSDPARWQIPESEWQQRRDLTGPEYYICSIDPPGCTDVDDALHVRQLPGNRWEVGVHIADVSYFVAPGSFLDREAAARCTTVYMVDRRLDMLPPLLSEHLASLREGSPRLAVSVIWTLSPQLEVRDVWFGQSVIINRHQLQYKQAQDVLDGKALQGDMWIPEDEQRSLRKKLGVVRDLADKLRSQRMAQGALELESGELQFAMGTDMQPKELLRKQKVAMMDIVAEMMIFANAAVAERIATVFPAAALLRNHAPPPRTEPFQEMSQLCSQLGINLDPTSNKSLARSLRAVSRSARNPGLISLLKSLMTRAMSQARYFSTGAPAPGGGGFFHYGLALPHYTHFTSPIRRYADVVVHRQLLASLVAAPSLPPLPHAHLSLAAETMNKRNQEAKRAQQASRQLYLLSLLASQPQVEKGLVCGLHPRGVEVFFASLQLKAKLYLLSKDGQVRPPAETERELQEDDPEVIKQRQHLKLQFEPSAVDIVDSRSGWVLTSIQLWQPIWVLMTAEASRTRGFMMRLQALAPYHTLVAGSSAAAAPAGTVQANEEEDTLLFSSSPPSPAPPYHSLSHAGPSPGQTSSPSGDESHKLPPYNMTSPSSSPASPGMTPLLMKRMQAASPLKGGKISTASGTGSRDRSQAGQGATGQLQQGFLYDVLQDSAEAARQLPVDATPPAGLETYKPQVPAPLALWWPHNSQDSSQSFIKHSSGSEVVEPTIADNHINDGMSIGSDASDGMSLGAAASGGEVEQVLLELHGRLAHYHARWNACGLTATRRSKLGSRMAELTELLTRAEGMLGSGSGFSETF